MPEELTEARLGQFEGPAVEETAPAVTPVVGVPPYWPRLAYALEFILTLLTGVVLWEQIGGQAHLDLIPWYLKTAVLFGLAWCAIRYTAALVEEPRLWNRRSGLWLSGVLAACLTMGAITLYYHLHEASESSDSDESSATTVRNRLPGRLDRNA